MKKLYRLMLVIIVMTGFAFQAKAQWTDDANRNLLISEPAKEGQDLVQVGKTSDDKVFIAWLSWENSSAYIKLQLLDKDGNALLGNGGMYVCKYPTPTWSSGFGFAVTPDNCVLIVNSDTRNGTENGWKPYIYKINQKGEQIWSNEGICLLGETGLSGIDPRICITSENQIVVGFRQLAKQGGGSAKIAITKLMPDGTKAWGGNINVVEMNTIFNVIPSLNGSFFVAYFELYSTNTGNYVMKKYTANGEELWEDKVYLDESGMVKTQVEPTWITDGAGGFVTGYRYSDGKLNYGAVQAFTSEGKYTLEDYDLGDLPVICTDPENKSVYAACKSGGYGESTLSLARYSLTGEKMWQNDDLIDQTSWQHNLYGVVAVGQSVYVIYRNALESDKMSIEYSKVTSEGETMAKQVLVSTPTASKDRGSLTVTGDQLVLAWTEKNSQTGGQIYAQRIKLENGSGILSQNCDEESGLNIYRNDEGTFTVEIEAKEAGTATLCLTDTGGSTRMFSVVNLVPGTNSFVCQAGSLSTGLYLLAVQSGSGRMAGKFLIK